MRPLARLVVTAVVLPGLGPSPAGAQPAVEVGFINPLTGGSSFYGQSLLHGAQLAVEQANARGGLLGKKIELVAEDDRSVPADGTSAAIKLITRDNGIAI